MAKPLILLALGLVLGPSWRASAAPAGTDHVLGQVLAMMDDDRDGDD